MQTMRNAWIVVLAVLAVLAGGAPVQAQAEPQPEQPVRGDSGVPPPGTEAEAEAPVQRSFQPPPPIRSGEPISVLVFPAVNAAKTDGQDLADYLLREVKSGIVFSNRFTVVTYSRQSSLVRRALQSRILTEEELDELKDPSTGEIDVNQARTIATRLGIQSVLLVSIDEVQVNPQDSSTSITATVQLLASETGNPIYQIAVTGKATPTTGQTPVEVMERAAADVARQVHAEMGVQPPPAGVSVGTPPPAKRHRGGLKVPPWLGVALFLTGLGSAIVD
ncbi:MAG: hypothetical protein HY320_02795 [Armatimonadetes bacterium]|nr:hypothetical protein [Armatimonadota bacterium]